MKLLNRRDWTLIALLVTMAVGNYVGAYCYGRLGFVLWPMVRLGMLPLAVLLALLFVITGFSSALKGGRAVQFFGRLLFVFVVLSFGCFNGGNVDLYRRGCSDHIKSTVMTMTLVDEVRQIAVKKLGNRESTGSEFFHNVAAFGLPTVFRNSGWGYPSHVTVIQGKDASRPHVHLEWGGALTGHHGLVITDEVIPPNGFPVYGGDKSDEPVFTTTYTPWLEGTYIMLDSN